MCRAFLDDVMSALSDINTLVFLYLDTAISHHNGWSCLGAKSRKSSQNSSPVSNWKQLELVCVEQQKQAAAKDKHASTLRGLRFEMLWVKGLKIGVKLSSHQMLNKPNDY